MSERRRGILRVTGSFLSEKLGLPSGHSVIGVRDGAFGSDTFDVLVDGPTLPVVQEGEVTPVVKMRMAVEFD